MQGEQGRKEPFKIASVGRPELLGIFEQLIRLHLPTSLQMELLFVNEGTGWTQGHRASRGMAARQGLQAQLCSQPAL